MSIKTGWEQTTQVKLIAELQGFWGHQSMGNAPQSGGNALLEVQSATATVPLQIRGDQWRAEVCVLEEVRRSAPFGLMDTM
jgi:hypothetical protein